MGQPGNEFCDISALQQQSYCHISVKMILKTGTDLDQIH